MKWNLLIVTFLVAVILYGTAAGAGTTGNSTTNSNSNLKTFNINQIIEASSTVKTFVENSNGSSLPNNVTIGNQTVTMPQFLYLMTSAVILINSNNLNSTITLINVSKPISPSQNLTSGIISKANYLIFAGNIKNYINANSRAPNYINTPLGRMSYESSVYTFSKILNFYKTNKRLPDTVSVKPWNYAAAGSPTSKITTTRLGNTSYGYVEKIGTFGTGPNKVAVIIGVHPLEANVHTAMFDAIKNANLTNIRIDVFRVVVYNATDYDTSRIQGETLANKYVVPNINTSYKLVIDTHGDRGNYIDPTTKQVVKDFIYAPSNGTLSKSYAYKLVNKSNGTLTYFYVSGTSPPKVTIPITKKGIPAVIFELYFVNVSQQVLNNKCQQFINSLNSIFV
jgi:hypothetical protein